MSENLKTVVSIGKVEIRTTDQAKESEEAQKFWDFEFLGCTSTYYNHDRAFLGGMQKTWGELPNKVSEMIEAGQAKALPPAAETPKG